MTPTKFYSFTPAQAVDLHVRPETNVPKYRLVTFHDTDTHALMLLAGATGWVVVSSTAKRLPYGTVVPSIPRGKNVTSTIVTRVNVEVTLPVTVDKGDV